MKHHLERHPLTQLQLTHVSAMAIIVSLLMVAIFLSSCASLGIPTPETFNQRIAAGYASVDGIAKTTTNLLTQKRIDVSDAENVLTQAKIANQGLDIARKTYVKDPAGGDAKLTAAISVLTALQAYLNTKGVTSGR